MMGTTYVDLLRTNASFSFDEGIPEYGVRVLSNVIVTQINEILEYYLRSRGINAVVRSGTYDNIVQDAAASAEEDLVVLFWEAVNIADGLHFRIDRMGRAEIDGLFDSVSGQLDLTFKSLASTNTVLFNRFSSLAFDAGRLDPSPLRDLCTRLNAYVDANAPSNVVSVDLERVLATVGIKSAIDRRFFYSARAPYTPIFFREWSRRVTPIVCSSLGLAKKALILDCDNTLWKGILGEDGFDGIHMAVTSAAGRCFAEVQGMVAAMAEGGVIVGLCSKNNASDVQDVLDRHPDMQLRDGHISVKRINWDDKAQNLISIAGELNIGIESLVFVDDSEFEIGRVRGALPDVTALQVPTRTFEYPSFMWDVARLFFQQSQTEEDRAKSRQYRDQRARVEKKAQFANVADYLGSLELVLREWVDEEAHIPRIAQLTQKTNQFNLTTQRHSQAQISSWVRADDHRILSFGLEDRFGDYGITAVSIIEIGQDRSASVETLLMSCRIIGRNVERLIIDRVVRTCVGLGVEKLRARYLPTEKNRLVADLWKQAGFEADRSSEVDSHYVLELSSYVPAAIGYIRLIENSERKSP